jgi:hypothetical protein
VTAASLDRSLIEMMNTPVTVYQGVTRDAYGAQTLGAGVVVLCHLSQGSSLSSTDDGEQAPTEAVLYLSQILNVDPASDYLTLPNGESPRIVRALVRYDERGAPHHEVVYLSMQSR